MDFRLNKFLSFIPEKHHKDFLYALNVQNTSRLKVFAHLIIVVSIGMLVLYFINLESWQQPVIHKDWAYLYEPLAALIIYSSILSFIVVKKTPFYNNFHNPLIWIHYVFYYLWGSLYTLHTLEIPNNVVSLVAGSVLITILFVVPPQVIITSLLLMLAVIIGGIYSLYGTVSGQLNIVFFLISFTLFLFVLSRIGYRSFVNNFLNKTRLLDEIEEKEKALLEVEDLNRRFESIIEERSKEILEINRQLTVEIKKHKETLNALELSEKYYREFLEFLPQIVFESNNRGQITYVNKQALIQFEYSEEELFGLTTVEALIADVDKERAKEVYKTILEKGVSLNAVRFDFVSKNQKIFPCLVYVHPIRINNEITGMRGILVNITELEKARKALEQSEQRFKDLTQLLPLPVFEIDTNLRLTYVNDKALSDFGYTKEDVEAGVYIKDVIAPQEIAKLYSKVATVSPENPLSQTEYLLKRKDGSLFQGIVYLSYNFSGKMMDGARGIVFDITEIRRAQKELEASEEKYRNLAENIDDGIFSTQQGIFNTVNRAMTLIFGYSTEELIGMQAWNLAAPEIREEIKNKLFEKTRMYDFTPLECECLRKDGTRIIVEIKLSKIIEGWGTYGIVTDVTERKKTERLIRESEEKYRDLIENMNEGVAIVDPNENFIFANDAACRIFGLKKEELLGRNVREFTTEDEFSKILSQTQLRMQGASSRYEIQIISANNETKICQLTATPKFDANGKYIASMGLLLDITQRKWDEEKIKQSEQKYRRIFENIQDVYFEISFEGTILEYSPSISFISKWDRYELIGRNIIEILANVEEYEKAKAELVKFGYVYDQEIKLKDKNGSIKICSVNARLILPEKDQTAKIIGSLHDITNRKIAETKLRESLKEKDILLKEIHHRVKNNLQIIHSLLSLQASTIADEELQNVFKEAQNRIKTMSLLHENIYRSKNFTQINIKDYIISLVSYVSKSYLKANQKVNIQTSIDNISLDIDTAIPVGLILTELISNSMKYAYSPDSVGTLKVSLNKDTEKVIMSVQDSGPGLPPNFDFQNSSSIGMKLIYGLSDQIGAKLSFSNEDGFCTTIAFASPN